MNSGEQRINSDLKYQDLVLLSDNMKLFKSNFNRIQTQNTGDINFE